MTSLQRLAFFVMVCFTAGANAAEPADSLIGVWRVDAISVNGVERGVESFTFAVIDDKTFRVMVCDGSKLYQSYNYAMHFPKDGGDRIDFVPIPIPVDQAKAASEYERTAKQQGFRGLFRREKDELVFLFATDSRDARPVSIDQESTEGCHRFTLTAESGQDTPRPSDQSK